MSEWPVMTSSNDEMQQFARVSSERRIQLEAPAIAPDVVAHKAVFERLASATGCTVFVSAPGGYGKTSQVANWARQDGRPLGWVQLCVGDDAASTLVSLLVDALTRVTDLDVGALPAGAMSPQQYTDHVAPALGRAIHRCETPFVLVLDDLHVLADEASIEIVVSIAQNVPSGSTVVLISRFGPGPAFARARIHPGIVEIATPELALDGSGVAAVLRSLGVPDDGPLLDRIASETAGWPAGVRLLGIESLAPSGGPDEAPAFDEPNRSLSDYVHTEWLRRLTSSESDFLMRVSGLDWLSGALCDHVLDRTDSDRVLRSLHGNRQTALPLDRHGGAYRMHRILKDVLLTRFEQIDLVGRQRVDLRASVWYELAGDVDRAVRHAARSGDAERAIRLINEHAPQFHSAGRHARVADWLGLVPRSTVVARADLCLVGTFSALGMGKGDEAMVWIRMARAAIRSDRNNRSSERNVDSLVAAVNALVGVGSVSELMSDARLAHDRSLHGPRHIIACEAYGVLAFATGDHEAACRLFAEGAAEAGVATARTDEAFCNAHLAVALDELGEGQRSHEAALRARHLLDDIGLAEVPTMVLVTAVSAQAAARDGDLRLAKAETLRTLTHLTSLSSAAGLVTAQARIALACAALQLHDHARADAMLDELRSHLSAWPDAVTPHRQLGRLEQRLRALTATSSVPALRLTEAELRVLRLLPTNLRHHEIADRLFVSRNTVKSHAASIYRKLGVASRSDAVDRARQAGLLPAL